MKAERRHELQTNELAQWLNNLIEQVKPHVNTILIVAIALVAIIFAVVYLSGRTSGQGGQAWEDYYRADAIEEVEQRITQLEHVQEDYPGTPAGLWAQLMAADARLVRGSNAAFKDRLAGEDDLEKAKSDLLAVISGAEKLPKKEGEMLSVRATWCLGRTYEALADDEKAIEQYEKLNKTWPKAGLAKAAAKQASYLKGLDDWFDWYAGVDPTKVKPTPRQNGGLPFGHPGIGGGEPSGSPLPGSGLPDDIDLTLPGPLDLDSSGGDQPFPSFDDDLPGEAVPTTPEADTASTTPGDSPSP